MINEQTIRILKKMDLEPLVEGLYSQELDTQVRLLPFDERLQMAIDHLYQEKHNSRVKGIIKRAKLRNPEADMTSVHFEKRSLDRHVLTELGTCKYVHQQVSVIFQGFTGSGKTYLACALGKEACKKGLRTYYIRMPDLLMERDVAAIKHQGESKLLTKLANFDLLIIDEWLLDDLLDNDLKFLLELLERRYDSRSTIYCTQFRKEDWHHRLGGGIHADAIMDRIVHRAVWFETGEMNMREFSAKELS